jgi:hypothetical protein
MKKEDLQPTLIEVKKYREEHGAGLYQAKEILIQQKLYKAIEYLLDCEEKRQNNV